MENSLNPQIAFNSFYNAIINWWFLRLHSFATARSSIDDFFQKLKKSVYFKIDLWLYFSTDFNNFFFN